MDTITCESCDTDYPEAEMIPAERGYWPGHVIARECIHCDERRQG